MRFKSFLIITSTIILSPATFAQQDKIAVVKPDSVGLSKPATRAIATPVGERGEPKLANKMDSKKEIFYSNAPMYVAPKAGGDPVTMLIVGTAKFDNNAQIIQVGQSSLTGDFVSVKDAAVADEATTMPLFPNVTAGKNTDGGIINFVGQWNKQKITRENRDLTAGKITLIKDNVKVANPNSVMYFPTIKVVKEGILNLKQASWPVNGETGLALTEAGMGDFLRTKGMLEVSSNVAMGIAKLDVTGGNRFVVEAVTDGLDIGAGTGVADKVAYYKINTAYVDIREHATGGTHPGYHELNMQLYDYDPTQNDGAVGKPGVVGNPEVVIEDPEVVKTNTIPVKKPAASSLPTESVNATFLRGFTSPFENLRADYMFYHVLTAPDEGGVNRPHPDDGRRRPIEDPRFEIKPGRGYFFAMDASREYYNDIQGNWHSSLGNTAWKARERGGYNFSRLLREWKYDVEGGASTKNFNLYHETTEKVAGSVAVAETQRFNAGTVRIALSGSKATGTHFYLANPFMTPISLNSLLTDGGAVPTTEAAADAYPIFTVPGLGARAVYSLANVSLPSAGAPLLRARYWIVNTGVLVHDYTGPGRYFYNVKYDVADLVTTPSTIGDAMDRYLEPMQMFVVQSASDGNIVFNNSLKTFKGKPFQKEYAASLTRSTFAAEPEAETESFQIPDWFVIQAVVEKEGGISADRTAVRFYESANEGYDNHDIEKKIISEEALTKARAGDNTYSDENISPTHVIYTTTAAGQPLLGNAVDYSVKEIPLHYLSGSSENEKVTFSFFGMEGFDKAPQGWLIDLHDPNKIKYELKEGLQYSFTATAEESSITAKNRFLLQFYDDGTTGPILTENPITCYYSGSTLHIGGLNEKDLGSNVYIYDLQGRLMGSTVINDYPGIEYRKVLGQGTFIVKIVGARNYGTKFVNLQNY